VLDDDLEINIGSQDHCTADHRLITIEFKQIKLIKLHNMEQEPK